MSDNDSQGPMQIVFVVVFFVSSLCSSIIPLMYYTFGKCKGHPMNLIAMICLLEMISNWNFLLIGLDIYQIESTIHLKNIFSALTFDIADGLNENNFCKFNDGFFVIVETLIVSFNLFFAIDLLITLRMPFYEGRKRQKIYNVMAVLLTGTLFGFMVSDLDRQCGIDSTLDRYTFPFLMSYLMLAFLVVAVAIIGYSTFVLRHTRTINTIAENRNNTREQYIIHHRRVLISLLACWLFPTLNNNSLFRDAITNEDVRLWMQYLSFMFLMFTGTFVNLVRLTEPHVRANFLEICKNLRNNCWASTTSSASITESQDTTAEVKEQRREEQAEAWNIPLSTAISQFNNQYVLQNIIQTVLELSKNTTTEELSKTFKMNESQADNLLDNLNQESISEVGRMKKKLELVCVNYESEAESMTQRTVFRRDQVPSIAPSAIDRLGSGGQEVPINNKDSVTIKATALSYFIFEKIRELSNIDFQQLEDSLDISRNVQSIKKTKESLGASGSFFFFSHDHRFVIKTIDVDDVDSLIGLLPKYYLHLLHEPNSIISRIFGLYTIEIANVSSITFILMENSFSIFDQMKLPYRKYDMKGSLMAREVRNPRAQVLKDINFFKSDEAFIYMKRDQKLQLLRQIEKDISIFEELNIMDYSLLLGVADMPNDQPSNPNDKYNWKFVSSCRWVNKKVYSISLIDYLQKFNCQKLLQLKYKTFFSSKTQYTVSSINSHDYRKRFMRFMSSIIVIVN